LVLLVARTTFYNWEATMWKASAIAYGISPIMATVLFERSI
jgi:hypothetical protein